jgi:hypothetical protein
MKAASPSPYSDIIIKTTGAAGCDVIMIKNIMREEIFHSTLDWQTARQLATAARAAQTMLRGDYEFYQLVLADRRLTFQGSKLEQFLKQATPGSASALALSAKLDHALILKPPVPLETLNRPRTK